MDSKKTSESPESKIEKKEAANNAELSTREASES